MKNYLRDFEISGIYIIRNNINSKFYIGSSNNIKIRWRTHTKLLKKNNHDNKHLQSAWNLYGEKAFSFEILESCPVEHLKKCEEAWLEITKCYKDSIGYNFLKPGEVFVKKARINSIKSRQRLAKEKIGIKTLHRYDLEGNYIDSWKWASTAEQVLKIFQANIVRASRKGGRAGNFLWLRGSKLDKISPNDSKYKRIIKWVHSNGYEIFKGTAETAKYFNYSNQSVQNWINNKTKFPFEGVLKVIFTPLHTLKVLEAKNIYTK